MNGPVSIPVTLATSASLAVGAGLTIYTDAIRLDGLDTFALAYIAACTGAPNVKIEMEQSIVAPTANALDLNSVVPETISEINAALVDELLHLQAIFPVGVSFIRFKITELSGITADTVLTMNLSVQNRFGT